MPIAAADQKQRPRRVSQLFRLDDEQLVLPNNVVPGLRRQRQLDVGLARQFTLPALDPAEAVVGKFDVRGQRVSRLHGGSRARGVDEQDEHAKKAEKASHRRDSLGWLDIVHVLAMPRALDQIGECD